jgi:hypothetical protein
MPLLIQINDERACPNLVCNHCQELVEDAVLAIVAWNESSQTEGTLCEAVILHKGCEPKVKPKLGSRMNLDEYLVRLLANLGTTNLDILEVQRSIANE